MTATLPRRIAWFAPWTWKRRTQIITTMLLLLVYPLSMGPAAAMSANGWMAEATFALAYYPIYFAAQGHPTVGGWVFWYLGLFTGLD